jgi:hypothetical protein
MILINISISNKYFNMKVKKAGMTQEIVGNDYQKKSLFLT